MLTNGYSGTFAPPLSISIDLEPPPTNPKAPTKPTEPRSPLCTRRTLQKCRYVSLAQICCWWCHLCAGELALVHRPDWARWADCFFYLQCCVPPELRLRRDCVRLGVCFRDVGVFRPPCDCRWLTDALCSLFDQATDKLWDNINKGRQWKDIRSRYVEDE